MGIFRRKLHSLLIPLLAFSFLTGCSGLKKKTMDVETVQDIFNNVNDTLEFVQFDYNNHETKFAYGYKEIFDQFTTQDYYGMNPRDFDYFDEPFVQFQYLKGVVDNEGENFKFGTKYYDTQTKDVFFRFDTCEIDATKDYQSLVNCDVIIGLDVKINTFNQISANVVFQNTYTLAESDISFTTNRYVNFLIDYDFSTEEPSYLLKAFTRNDELSAPYVGYVTYQYDSIKVVNGLLTEFRRFNIETNKVFSPDESHSNFLDFVSDGISYRVDSVKWYVDGSYYVSKYMSESKQRLIGEHLFELGMFEPFSYMYFLDDLDDHQSINTDKIYSSISYKVYGNDIQYIFLTKNPSSIRHINEDSNPYYHPETLYPDIIDELRACLSNGSRIPQYVCSSTTTIKNIFTGFEDRSSGSYVYVPLYYFSKGVMKDQVPSSSVTKPSLFYIYFSVVLRDGSVTEPIFMSNLSTNLRTAYESVDSKYYIDYSSITDTFRLKIYDRTKDLQATVDLKYGDSLEFLSKNTSFPVQLLNYGVPAYTDEGVLNYSLDTFENGYGCTISPTSSSAMYQYIDLLITNGFRGYHSDGSEDYPTEVYYKEINSSEYLFIKIYYKDTKNGRDNYYLRAYHVKYSSKSNETRYFPESIMTYLGVPAYPGNSSVIYDLQADGLYIYNSSYGELYDYVNTLANRGFSVVKSNAKDGYYVLRENDNSKEKIYEIRFTYYQKENRDFYVSISQVDNPDYIKYLDVYSLYMTSYYDSWSSTYANKSIKFIQSSSTYWRLSKSTFLVEGKEFKFIANGDWNVSNPGVTYKGFGYDDVGNISSYSSFFARGDDGKIIVLQNCIVDVRCSCYDTFIEFTISPTAVDPF